MTVNPLNSAIEDYSLALESEGRAPATLRFEGYALRRFAAYAGTISPAQYTPALLRAWLKGMADDSLSVTSQRDYLRAVKSWSTWLSAEDTYGIGQRPAAGESEGEWAAIRDALWSE